MKDLLRQRLFWVGEEGKGNQSTFFVAAIHLQVFWKLRIASQNLDGDTRRFLELNDFSPFFVVEIRSDTFVDSHHDPGGTILLAG